MTPENRDSADTEKYLAGLAEEFAEILAKNLLRDTSETDPAMTRIHEIRDEVESYGCLITYYAKMTYPGSGHPEVTATLWKPRPGLTPEEKKEYDTWFEQKRREREIRSTKK